MKMLHCYKFSPNVLVAMFLSIAILIFAERGVFSAVIHLLKDGSIGLTDTEVGILGSIFMFGFMIASPVAAHLS